MPTVVTYNGIVMNSVTTTKFDQTPEYDPSGTDIVGSRFSMAFEGICHAQPLAGGTPLPWIGAGNGSARVTVQQAFTLISQALAAPRAKLTVMMGNQMILVCNPANGNTAYDDIENGPKPKNVRLSHITSNNSLGPTFHVTFEIDCVRDGCASSSGSLGDVLSNRWSVSEDFDSDYYTIRTIAGQIRFSANNIDADQFRDLVVPTLETGFKRESLTWNISADGLHIDYHVVDRQIETAPPWPATKISVRHSESTTTLATSFEAEVHVTLAGHPGAPKMALLAIGVRILESRLALFKKLPDGTQVVVLAFGIVDSTGDRNEIELYLKCNHTVDWPDGNVQNGKNILGTPLGNICRPLDLAVVPIAPAYTVDKSEEPDPWGYGGDGNPRGSKIAKLALYCYTQTPCSDANRWVSRTSTPASSGEQGDSPKPDPKVYSDPSFTYTGDGKVTTQISSAGSQTLFTHATSETILSINPLRVQLPIASDPTKWDGKSDTCVMVALGLPQATMSFHVESERTGEWPDVPEPVPQFNDSTTGLKGSLLSAVLTPLPPTTDATATKPIYHISARIVYGLNRPPRRDEKIPVGVLQWTKYTPKDTALQLSTLYDSSVQPVTTTPSAGTNQGARY